MYDSGFALFLNRTFKTLGLAHNETKPSRRFRVGYVQFDTGTDNSEPLLLERREYVFHMSMMSWYVLIVYYG